MARRWRKLARDPLALVGIATVVTVTVAAYDENFEALSDEALEGRTLSAELISPGRGGSDQTRNLAIPMLRKGVFEARIPVFLSGDYRVRVKELRESVRILRQILPRLEATGLKLGSDFFLAYSPEREDPGNQTHSTRSIPKLVGGVDQASGELAALLYRQVVAEVVPVAARI